MLKKKDISLFLILAAIVAFSATQAMADNPPTSCTFQAGTTTYTLTPVAANDGTFPLVSTGTTGTTYYWAYQLVSSTGSLNGIGAMDGLVPVCDPDMGYAPVGGGQLLLAGRGDTALNSYGLGDTNDYVMSMNAQSTSTSYGGVNLPVGAYVFSTTKAGNLQNTPMAIKIGTKTYYCSVGGVMAGIVGPACYQPAKIGAETLKIIELDHEAHPGIFWTVILGTDGTIIKVLDETGAVLPWQPITSLGSFNGLPLTSIPPGILLKFGNNSCFNYTNSFGQACQKCY